MWLMYVIGHAISKGIFGACANSETLPQVGKPYSLMRDLQNIIIFYNT